MANRIEQLQLSQLKSPQLKELVRRLKHLYKVESPKVENLRHENIPNPYADFRVEERWQEIQGCKQWDGLLDPLDPVLRAEIVRYGELAQAAYDAFDGDTSSKYCGSCKYTKESLLEKVGLENRGYEIYQYLYATAELDLPNFFTTSFLDDKWSKDSNWMGFVAVCTSPQEIARLGRRDIVVAWRGTITKFEWICDVQVCFPRFHLRRLDVTIASKDTDVTVTDLTEMLSNNHGGCFESSVSPNLTKILCL